MSKAISTRSILGQIGGHLKESVGIRAEGETGSVATGNTPPQLSPVASPRDIGRRPTRKFGRVEIDRIVPDPEQPRSEFDPEQLQQLADSLKERGQLAPIRVRWSEDASAWMIISGERRWRAAKVAALNDVACFFHDDGLTRDEVLHEQLIENMLRADLKPVEEAKSYRELMDLNGWGVRELARSLRVNPSRVSRALALLKLPDDLQEQIEAGELSARAGYELSKLDNTEQQRNLAATDDGPISHADAAVQVRRRSGKRQATRGERQTIVCENGWKITATSPRKGD